MNRSESSRVRSSTAHSTLRTLPRLEYKRDKRQCSWKTRMGCSAQRLEIAFPKGPPNHGECEVRAILGSELVTRN